MCCSFCPLPFDPFWGWVECFCFAFRALLCSVLLAEWKRWIHSGWCRRLASKLSMPGCLDAWIHRVPASRHHSKSCFLESIHAAAGASDLPAHPLWHPSIIIPPRDLADARWRMRANPTRHTAPQHSAHNKLVAAAHAVACSVESAVTWLG